MFSMEYTEINNTTNCLRMFLSKQINLCNKQYIITMYNIGFMNEKPNSS